MKNNTELQQGISMIRRFYLLSLILIGLVTAVQAQEAQRPQPTFWLGVSGAANLNYFTGTTQTLNSSIIVPAAFHDGFGVGLAGSVLFEYHFNPVVGLMLNLGYENRGGAFNQTLSPCNCPETLHTPLAYLTAEPSLRIAPFSSGFYLYVGGGYGYNINKSFTYTFVQNPESRFNSATGDFSNIRKNVFSGQIGAGYDIPISAFNSPTQVMLSPFVSYHPYFGRDPRSVESWTITTIRIGVALKFGKAAVAPVKEVAQAPAAAPVVVAPVVIGGEVGFAVQAPSKMPATRRINETFPLRNYIFFEENSSEIPSRYVRLSSDEAKKFNESQLREPDPKELSGRSQRQLRVYYNVLNILGDRMRANPNATVILIGSSAGKGSKIGKGYAESVKLYLVDVYGIDASRIKTEGRDEPIIKSEQPGGTLFLPMLRDGDRRVDIVSKSYDLLTPLHIKAIQDEPIDSRIVLTTKPGTNVTMNSWSVDVADEQGTIQHFGPFTKEKETIPGNIILGSRNEGNYTITMIWQTKEGNTIKKESTLRLERNAAPKVEGLRFSVLFDFDKSKTVTTYEKFLTEKVVPLIEDNGTVIIHGHTDIIGEDDYNMVLSQKRAQDTQNILERALSKAGKKGVKYEVYGFGSDVKTAPFENQYPEQRFYNRTVVIDIVPAQ